MLGMAALMKARSTSLAVMIAASAALHSGQFAVRMPAKWALTCRPQTAQSAAYLLNCGKTRRA
jgi:hypothetical protein